MSVRGRKRTDAGHRLPFSPLLTLLALTLVWLMFQPAAARALPPTPTGFFGASGRNETDRDFQLMQQAGVGTYRTLFHFRAAKRKRQSFYDWRRFDRLVRAATQRGVTLLPLLYGTPDWIGADTATPPIHSMEARREWERLLVELVSRYGPEGTFWKLNPLLPRRPIRTWQIWNEPNDPSYWHPTPNPTEFATLMQLSSFAIRSVDEGARIISGGIVARPGGEGAIDGEDFLAGYLRTPGSLAQVAGVGYHPYSRNSRAVKTHLRKARRALNAAGGRGSPLWVTEVGWASQGSGMVGALFKSERGQARVLRQTFRMILRKRSTFGIHKALWYYWRDHWDPYCAWCRSAGMLGNQYRAKPSLGEFKLLTG